MVPQDLRTDGREAAGALLDQIACGRRRALDELVPIVYDTLREIAHRQRRVWKGNDTLNTTALVHEAYLKLVGPGRRQPETTAHFLAAAARAVRHILINYARDRRAQKRGGAWERVPFCEEMLSTERAVGHAWEDRVLTLEEALVRLASRSERQSRIVECRFFAGMTAEQTARALGVSTATVTRGWALARAWLHRELGGAPVESAPS